LQWSLFNLIIFGINLFALTSGFLFSSCVSIVVTSTAVFWSFPLVGAFVSFYVTAGATFLLLFLSSFFSSIKVFEFSFSAPDSSWDYLLGLLSSTSSLGSGYIIKVNSFITSKSLLNIEWPIPIFTFGFDILSLS
jgi:hypothetical protein